MNYFVPGSRMKTRKSWFKYPNTRWNDQESERHETQAYRTFAGLFYQYGEHTNIENTCQIAIISVA